MTHLYNNIINNSLERNDIDFKNKTIIVVDDGAATGSTIIAAIRSVRKNMDPKRLIVALPISPRGSINILKNEDIDLTVVITSPQNRNFISLQQYYQHYDQITDKQVKISYKEI
jgi:putative phosphoribosyl transferase